MMVLDAAMQAIQILLVEDNGILNKVMACYLVGMGLQVTTARTVERAMYLLHNQCFDVLVTDMHLPDNCGIGLVRLLRDSSTPVVVMTAEDTVFFREQVRHAGAAVFLEKPFPLVSLKRILNRLLAGYRYFPSSP